MSWSTATIATASATSPDKQPPCARTIGTGMVQQAEQPARTAAVYLRRSVGGFMCGVQAEFLLQAARKWCGQYGYLLPAQHIYVDEVVGLDNGAPRFAEALNAAFSQQMCVALVGYPNLTKRKLGIHGRLLRTAGVRVVDLHRVWV